MPEFIEGWNRYWHTFARPWPVVAGFAVASMISTALYELVKWTILQCWRYATAP